MTLVRDEMVTLARPAPARRTGGDEDAAYDSSEEDEGIVETRWVRAGNWRDQRVPLGVLPAGVYLARVHGGAYAASALVAVSDLTLLVRRGDHHDVAAVATADGTPDVGVGVSIDGGAAAATDARGEVRFDASAPPTRRFVAHRGSHWAWADAAHARLDACDVRVYLDPGRPVFRVGETLHLRGHVRGCVGPRDAPLANESVRVEGGASAPVDARTDADGNFVAELAVNDVDLRAVVRGRPHARTIVLDHRAMPSHSLVVSADRAFAAAGETVRVRAGDDADQWPDEASVEFEFMGQRRRATAGPGHAAEATFTVGGVTDAARREVVRATLDRVHAVVLAQTEVWVGRRPVVLHVEGGRAARGAAPLWLRAEDLGGARLVEPLSLRVAGSDGNRAVSPVRWSGRAVTSAGADVRADVALPGAGPWWVTVASERGAAVEAGTVVWERDRPPSFGARGELAVRTERAEATAGGRLAFDLMRPPRGATWVTLEQSGVWASAWVAANAAPTESGWWRAALDLPPDADGRASVVATHLADGSVTTATSVVTVATAPALALRVESDARAYAGGATMHATITARGADGSPRDAVVSLWLADEGYWDLAPETYPAVDAMLSLPGRPASGADSSRPRAWGADEGRRVDPEARFNGALLPHLTRYDAWNAGGDLIDVTSRGMFGAVADAVARAAGLAHADVCPARAASLGAVSLEARDVPWDLLAVRIAERTDTTASVADRTLRFDCEASLSAGGSGRGYGSGVGQGLRGSGTGGIERRTQRLEGDQFFLGARHLGADGRLDVDVPLPAHPGRWRLQALAIDEHGRGDRASTTVTTSRPLVASIDAPTTLRPADRATVTLAARAPTLAGQRVAVLVEADGLAVTSAPTSLDLDAHGDGRARFVVTPSRVGTATLSARVGAGPVADAVLVELTARDDDAVVPLSLRAVADGRATDVDVNVPALAREATVLVELDPALTEHVDEVLAALAGPRWSAPSIVVERLAAMRTLEGVAVDEPQRARIAAAIASMAAQLAEMRGPDGGVAWWRAGSSDAALTATMLTALGPSANDPVWRDAWAFVRGRAATATGAEAGRIVEALTAPGDAALVRSLLARMESDATLPLDAIRAAYTAARSDEAAMRRWAARLRAGLAAALDDNGRVECRGASWFLCYAREGRRAELARALRALPPTDPTTTALQDRVLRWLSAHPASSSAWWWGSSEADVLALLARPSTGGARGSGFVVFFDGREVARGDHEHPARVPVLSPGTLRVSLAASPGRVARVRVSGSLALAPVGAATGTVPLERRLDAGADGPTLALRWSLPREATGVELRVPLPAGVELARPSGSRVRVTATERDVGWWSALDRAPRALRPVVERRDGALVLRFARLGAGAHSLALPLVATGAGRYAAGGAWLRTDDPAWWAVTPPMAVENP